MMVIESNKGTSALKNSIRSGGINNEFTDYDIFNLTKSMKGKVTKHGIGASEGRSLKFDPANALRGPVFSRKPRLLLRNATEANKKESYETLPTSQFYLRKTSNPLLTVRRLGRDNSPGNNDSGIHDPPVCEDSSNATDRDCVENCLGDASPSKSATADDIIIQETLPVLMPNNNSGNGAVALTNGKLLSKRQSYQATFDYRDHGTIEPPKLTKSTRLTKISVLPNNRDENKMLVSRPLALVFASGHKRAITGTTKSVSKDLHGENAEMNTQLWLQNHEKDLNELIAEEAIRKSIMKCKAWILKHWEYL